MTLDQIQLSTVGLEIFNLENTPRYLEEVLKINRQLEKVGSALTKLRIAYSPDLELTLKLGRPEEKDLICLFGRNASGSASGIQAVKKLGARVVLKSPLATAELSSIWGSGKLRRLEIISQLKAA